MYLLLSWIKVSRSNENRQLKYKNSNPKYRGSTVDLKIGKKGKLLNYVVFTIRHFKTVFNSITVLRRP